VGGVGEEKCASGLRDASLPYHHQPVRLHLEFRGALLDSGLLVWRLYGAEPNGLGGALVDVPHDRLRGSASWPCRKYRPRAMRVQSAWKAPVLKGMDNTRDRGRVRARPGGSRSRPTPVAAAAFLSSIAAHLAFRRSASPQAPSAPHR
jgi:hypothetical protein